MQIVPMRDLKDTVKIESLCSETKEPVFITKNGYGRLVVMDLDTFDRLLGKAYEAKMLNQAFEDEANGRTKDGPKTIDKLRKKHSL